MAFRFTVTAAVLVWFITPTKNQLTNLLIISFISATLQYSLTFSGLSGLNASATALIIQLEIPFLVIIGAFFSMKRLGGDVGSALLLRFMAYTKLLESPKLVMQ